MCESIAMRSSPLEVSLCALTTPDGFGGPWAAAVMVGILRSLPLPWEMQVELSAPGFASPKLWPSWTLESICELSVDVYMCFK